MSATVASIRFGVSAALGVAAIWGRGMLYKSHPNPNPNPNPKRITQLTHG
eukprot:NODE_2913_length_624_cov_72.085217_g2429_i0.p3 GENE.NODE_2913_length_624_cov_72.085217_g2429_i0~~NODE_2913_length_624_cov_72.085217_g2429_i0.p3  ORF type:complete len:50 (-),score=3.06 NODE_2913_length_624_cov_72.085217_g2429_i0:195-344(-)